LKERIAVGLDDARRRSFGLVDPIPEEEQLRQQSPIMSPLVWDLAHVGNYEELWLLRVLAGMPSTSSEYDDLYNPLIHPRSTRANLPLLEPKEARAYMSDVRGRVLDVLETVELDPANRLLNDGYVYGFVMQHEHQHNETITQTRQLMLERSGELLSNTPAPDGRDVGAAEVLVHGGPFTMGTNLEPWAYDNERPAHEIDVPSFWVDVTPVTNRAYLEFIISGSYDEPRYWTEPGWSHRLEEGLEHPQYWRADGGGSWSVLRFGKWVELRLDEPVQHVCWYEADAYARWAGKRLPSEAEWEKAASWDPAGGKRRYPWGSEPPTPGRANLGHGHPGPAGAGAYPEGVSPWGCHQMLGDVWEWTSTDFNGYPGFERFPDREFSDWFFGTDCKVLRGGSWATHPEVARNTFRNYDLPIRRQIFCGFRCARDA
jgi:gamma-glutamyl hercynylcysteine S-oxide synthase